MYTKGKKHTRYGVILISIVVIILSLFVLKPILSSVETYSSQFESLDKKRNVVLQLVASSSAASAVITLIPDDVGTPIAEQLASLSSGFMLILSVLLAEKYLLPILGGLTTTIIIPFTCILLIVYSFKRNHIWLRNIIIKLFVLAFALGTLIPISIFVSDTVEETFQSSINSVVNSALDSEKNLNVQNEQDKGIWEKITGTVSGALDYVGKAVDIAKNVLGRFVEAVAVMMVTNCIIPILILVIYLVVIRFVFGIDFSIKDNAIKALSHQWAHRQKNNDTLLT